MRGMGRPDTVRVRVTKEERAAFEAAAGLSGLSLSSWARMVMRQSASEQLAKAGKDAGLAR